MCKWKGSKTKGFLFISDGGDVLGKGNERKRNDSTANRLGKSEDEERKREVQTKKKKR